MKLQRAIVLMFAGLAVGVGARLGLTASSEGMDRRDAVPAPERTSRVIGAPAAEKTPRPAESDILNATGGRRLRMLMAWLPGADGDELPRMADLLTTREMEENLSIRLLMARWAEVDPAAMLAWAKKQASAVFSRMSVGQKVHSLNLIMEPSDVVARMLESAIRELPDAPADAARTIRGLTVSDFTGRVTSSWAETDPAAAALWVGQLPPGEPQAIAAANLILTWGRDDLPAARTWVASLPAGPARERAEKELAEIVAVSGSD